MKSREQCLKALERANEVRHGYVELKRALTEQEIDLAEAMDDPRAAGPLTIGKLMLSCPELGPSRTRRILLKAGVPNSARVESLQAVHQRRILEAIKQRDSRLDRERKSQKRRPRTYTQKRARKDKGRSLAAA